MGNILIKPPQTVHLIGICGTGMGALAGLLVQAGYRVTGSDSAVYPPMSDVLSELKVEVATGYRRENLAHRPDLVVIGNVCRPGHPEAVAAKEMGLETASMPRVLHDLFLADRHSVVIAGTHGKTTTSALTAFLLDAAQLSPSFLIGGAVTDFGAGFRLAKGPAFVVEGDEYDSAFFEKRAKFLSYAPRSAVITSVEHDHVDIYPSFEGYKAAFEAFAELVAAPGPLAVYAGDPEAMRAARRARVEVVPYATDADRGFDRAAYRARLRPGTSLFELEIEGTSRGLFESPLGGRHNIRNALAALVMAHRGCKAPLEVLRQALPRFQGIKRRQELLGKPRGIAVYDDFAHHPTAVAETIAALAPKHPPGRLLVAFEPRSATACRRQHQQAYTRAFDGAGRVIIAPLGRSLPPDESLDTQMVAHALRDRGVDAFAAQSLDDVLDDIASWARPGDGVALLSNGSFGGLYARVLEALQS